MNGIDNFTTVFTGKITGADVDLAGNYNFNIRDASFDRFRVPIDGVLNLIDFPDMPPRQNPVLAPIIYGDVSSEDSSDIGAVPCYLVTQQNPYRYLVAQHACKSIDNVYLYGSLVDPGDYSVTESAINGKIYTFIDFTSDQRDSTRPNEYEITADVQGRTDDGTSSGNLISDPVEALQDFLLNFTNTLSGEVDSTAFTAAAALSIAASYLIGAWIGDASMTIMDAINNWSQSFMIQFFVNRSGLFSVSILIADSFYSLPGGYTELTDDDDIIRQSFRLSSNKDLASILQYSYSFRWQEYLYEFVADQEEEDEEENIGQSITRQDDYPYVRDSATAHKVSATKLLFLREDLQFAYFDLPITHYNIDLNDYVCVTHFRGPSSDGTGYSSEIFRILSLTLDFEPTRMRIAAYAVKIPDSPEHADSHADSHADGHQDIAHGDHPHADNYVDLPHSDQSASGTHLDSHTDTHSDVSHQDTGHADAAHSDGHSDTYTDSEHGDSYTDTEHTDTEHTDTTVDQYVDYGGPPHGDYYIDYHLDSAHSDVAEQHSHVDSAHSDYHGDGHIDSAHGDTEHADVTHQDTHSDVHSDYHADTPHADTSHVDSHGDSQHTDYPYSDEAHADTIHADFHCDSEASPIFA